MGQMKIAMMVRMASKSGDRFLTLEGEEGDEGRIAYTLRDARGEVLPFLFLQTPKALPSQVDDYCPLDLCDLIADAVHRGPGRVEKILYAYDLDTPPYDPEVCANGELLPQMENLLGVHWQSEVPACLMPRDELVDRRLLVQTVIHPGEVVIQAADLKRIRELAQRCGFLAELEALQINVRSFEE